MPSLVLAEAGYLVAKALGPSAEAALLRAAARGEFRLEPPTSADLKRMAELVEQYADLPLGTVDASVVATAERLGQAEIATLDRRHFTVVRSRHAEASRSCPDEPGSPRVATTARSTENEWKPRSPGTSRPIHTPSCSAVFRCR